MRPSYSLRPLIVALAVWLQPFWHLQGVPVWYRLIRGYLPLLDSRQHPRGEARGTGEKPHTVRHDLAICFDIVLRIFKKYRQDDIDCATAFYY